MIFQKLKSIKNLIFNKINKKPFLYLNIIILFFFIIFFLIWNFSQTITVSEPKIFVPEKTEEEKIIQQQLKELEKLKEGSIPFTEEEIQIQVKELEKLRQEIKPLSSEEIQKQLVELNKLKE